MDKNLDYQKINNEKSINQNYKTELIFRLYKSILHFLSYSKMIA